MKTIKKNTVGLLLLCALSQSGYAAHPLVTEDTGTQDEKNSQIEINTDWIKEDGARTRSGAFTYSYGILKNMDLFINLPGTFSSPSGMNDVSIGIKWRFAENGPASMAIKPELLLPTGSETRGLGNGRTSAAVTLIGSYDAAPWAFHGNVGMTLNHYALQADRDVNRSAIWRASAAFSYAVNEQWKLVADTGISRNSDKASSDHPVYFLAGVIYSPTKNLDIDAGARFGVGCGQCQTGLDRQFGAGLTWRF